MRKGFTLIELLIVLAIMVFLLSMLMGMVFMAETPWYLVVGWILVIVRGEMFSTGSLAGVLLLVVAGLAGVVALTRLIRYRPEPHDELDPEERVDVRPIAVWALLIAGLVCVVVSADSLRSRREYLQTTKRGLIAGGNAGRMAECRNNLKHIGLGAHDFHDENKAFPPGAILGPSGEQLHGWQTHLLPYIEHQGRFQGIDLQQSWNAPANAPHFQQLVWQYVNPGVRREWFQFDADGFALSHYSANQRVIGGERRMPLREMTDGTSATIMAGEINANFRPWGRPGNWRDPAIGLRTSPNGFGSPFLEGVQFLFCDGRVVRLSDKTDPRVLRALSTPGGGDDPGEF